MPFNTTPYTGPILVTVVYFTVYYGFIVHATQTRFRLSTEYRSRGEKFDRYFHQDREMLTADRLQLNTLEQMVPFLTTMWLNAVFVSPRWATVLGVVYILARAVYPLAMGARLGRGVRFQILFSTLPGYLIIGTFLVSLLWAIAR